MALSQEAISKDIRKHVMDKNQMLMEVGQLNAYIRENLGSTDIKHREYASVQKQEVQLLVKKIDDLVQTIRSLKALIVGTSCIHQWWSDTPCCRDDNCTVCGCGYYCGNCSFCKHSS